MGYPRHISQRERLCIEECTILHDPKHCELYLSGQGANAMVNEKKAMTPDIDITPAGQYGRHHLCTTKNPDGRIRLLIERRNHSSLKKRKRPDREKSENEFSTDDC